MLQNPPYLITPVSGAGVTDEAYSRVPPASTTELEKIGVGVGSFGLNRSGVNSLIDLHVEGFCEQRGLRRSGHYREAGLLSLATSISKIRGGAEDDGLLKRGMIDLLESRAGVYIDHVQSVKHKGRQSTNWADRKLKWDRKRRGSGDEFVFDIKKANSIKNGLFKSLLTLFKKPDHPSGQYHPSATQRRRTASRRYRPWDGPSLHRY